MIIALLSLYIVQSLYLLKQESNNLLINLSSQMAIISLSEPTSIIQDNNTYEYCNNEFQEYKHQVKDINGSSEFRQQYKINNFSIFDNEKNQYNTEVFVFLHINKILLDHLSILTLNPLKQNKNSLVYFGYSLCRSEQDGYLITQQNEYLEKNKLNINGIKSKIYDQSDLGLDKYIIQIQYLEIFNQVFDIQKYSIFINDQINYIAIPFELIIKIELDALINGFYMDIIDDQDIILRRKTQLQRIEYLSPIKLYNSIDQPLLIMPEDYISYKNNQRFDLLKLISFTNQYNIILGRPFIKKKIFHFNSLTQEIYIEQLLEEKCNLQLNEIYVAIEVKIINAMFILVLIIFGYAIFRRIRIYFYHNIQKKQNEQQFILKQEVEILK